MNMRDVELLEQALKDSLTSGDLNVADALLEIASAINRLALAIERVADAAIKSGGA